jgi:hypothetical protein
MCDEVFISLDMANLVKLEKSWADKDDYFFLMERCEGKLLIPFLIETNNFDENLIRKIIK